MGSALYAAFAEVEKRLTTSHLVEAAKEIIPLSRSRRQEIEALRHWASRNCQMASLPADRPSDPHGESLSERRGRMLEY